MLFNSTEYLIFLPVVVAIYYAIKPNWRWLLLLLASYFFYMCWKPEYIILIMASTLVDYYAGLQMAKIRERSKRKKYLVLSLIVNLGILFGFKYFNLFSEGTGWILEQFNIFRQAPELNVLLPVGISFYTFQTIGYSIDVYRGVTKPEHHLGKFALYVSFFPQLVAGPIERSNNLLPQIHQKKEFNQQRFVSGLKLIIWGFFKKLVIADRLGIYVSSIYEVPGENTGLPVILATMLFAFQLYCDFSGYTDIARGSARLMGFDLMVNFNRPMIARTIGDFWQRWHISLTTWFRDYLYFSLPNKNKSKTKILQWKLNMNLMITYLLMGFWHGANWTFLLFGLIHSVYMIIENSTLNFRASLIQNLGLNKAPRLLNLVSILITFGLLCFSIFFFRSPSIRESFVLISNSLNLAHFGEALLDILKNKEVMFGILNIILLLVVEQYHAKHNLIMMISNKPLWIRWSIYVGFIFYVILFGIFNRQVFIYFQF